MHKKPKKFIKIQKKLLKTLDIFKKMILQFNISVERGVL